MIKINNLKKVYNKKTVLNIDELIIPASESFGLVGNNGAGKTTMFRLILDLIKADDGEVFSKENKVSKSEVWKFYTASYLDEVFLFDFLKPVEYYELLAELYKKDKREIKSRLKDYSDFLGDEILENKKYIREFSKGNKQKIGVIGALLINPEVIILDEPFSNLDPTSQIKLKNLIKTHNEQYKTTFLVSSHDLNHITEICERIVILEDGMIKNDIRTSADTINLLKDYFTV